MFAHIGTKQSEEVWIPDFCLNHREGQRYEWLRGYGHILAVFFGEDCVGWTVKEHLELNGVELPRSAGANIPS